MASANQQKNGRRDKIRLCILIHRMAAAGAQRRTAELALGLDKARYDVTVMTFYAGGLLYDELMSDATRVISLGKAGRWDVLRFSFRAAKAARRLRPHVTYSFLVNSNLLSLVFKKCVQGSRLIWAIADAGGNRSESSLMVRLLYWAQRKGSRFADLFIANSAAGIEHYAGAGFERSKMRLVPNGFDTERFRPTDEGAAVREEWRARPNERLIGHVGRLDPVKDHPTFLRAAALLMQERDDVRFVCVGGGPQSYREKMQRLSQQLGTEAKVIWAGERHDMVRVYNALDLCTCSSTSEGLPNIIGEAMACGVPCVSTDVGDAAKLVGDAGLIVPPRAPEAMDKAWKTLLDHPQEEQWALKRKARGRIIQQYNLEKFITSTEEVIESLL